MEKNLKRKNSASAPSKRIKQKTDLVQASLSFSTPKAADPAIHTFQHPEIHILSWNVNGIRAWIKKENVMSFVNRPELDIICFNETKLQETHVKDFMNNFPNYPYQSWNCSTTKLGYSGTAILSKVKPIAWEKKLLKGHPSEGRIIMAEFLNFFLLVTYVPNSGYNRFDYRIQKWDKDLKEYIKELENRGKGVIWIGDLNVINEDIDVYSLVGNEDCAGGTPQERKSFKEILDDDMIDSFRFLYQDKRQYTWFNVKRKVAKPRNEGWRFDMAILSRSLLGFLKNSLIYDQVCGSDHYPIELVLNNSNQS